MAPRYWMITNRNLTEDGFGHEFAPTRRRIRREGLSLLWMAR
jgi:hypothetical protein